MASTWPPNKDSELVPWATNFSTLVTATPTAFGLLAADATALAALLAAFVTSFNFATNPATRTPVTITNKEVAKAALIADIRSLARRIQATLSVTPGQKESLGLPVHKTTPTPIPAPVTRPVVSVVGGSVGLAVNILLVDEATPTKKAKPFGVDGAEIYSYVPAAAEAPPEDLEQWRFEGIAKRSSFEIDFNAADAGKTATIKALWFSTRGEPGPASSPVITTVAA